MAFALIFVVVGALLNQASSHPEAASPNNVGIIGGHSISIESAPYMASLRQNGSHFCGGTIIHEQFIVTAAHCIVDISEGQIAITPGMQVMVGTSSTDGHKGKLYDIESIMVHSGYYDSEQKESDIALIKLQKPLTFGPKVDKIDLAVDLTIESGSSLEATGWGDTKFGGHLSTRLRQVKVPLADDEVCETEYGDEFTSDMMICAGAHGRDTCQGDSGGPLTYDDSVLVGVTSFGNNCGQVAGVYTKVASFFCWIMERVHSNN